MEYKLATGTQFLDRASNSHYNAHASCVRMVNSSFVGRDLVIPSTVQMNGTPCYLHSSVSCHVRDTIINQSP